MFENKTKKRRREIKTKEEKELEELIFGKNILEDITQQQQPIKQLKKKEIKEIKDSVWNDDEEDINFNLNQNDRLKKLKKLNKNIISSTNFENLLKERFISFLFFFLSFF